METTVIVVAVVLAVAVGLVVRRRLGFMTMVDSDSMVPTLSPGQLLLSRPLRGSRPVRRGDVVVVRSAELGRMFVKRTVGLPGEHLEVAAGEVWVNGKRLLEPYVTRRGGLAGSFASRTVTYSCSATTAPGRATAAAGGSRTCQSQPCAGPSYPGEPTYRGLS